MKLRQYQRDALNSYYLKWGEGFRKPISQMATGTGKTIMFSNMAKYEASLNNRILTLINREELLQQFKDKLSQSTGLDCGVERAGESAYDTLYPIVVGSVQSLSRDTRLEKYHPDFFDLIIVDEAHLSAADTYVKIFDHFQKARIAGFTATAFRNDKRSLGNIYDCTAHEYSMRQAINDGWLVPIKAQTLPINIDMSSVRTQMGDYSDKDCASAIEPYLEQIARGMMEHAPERTHIVFLPLVDTSKKMAEICNKVGFRAGHVDGMSPDREQILSDYEAGKYNVMCNAQLLSYGYDNPAIDSVVWLRPTQSNLIYIQGIGRGTRISPPYIVNECETAEERRQVIANSSKPDLLLLDFLWNSARHKLCHPAVLFSEDPTIAEKATVGNAGAGGPEDLEDVVSSIEVEVQNEREASLAKYIEANKGKKKQKLDPIEHMLSIVDDSLVTYEATFDWQKCKASSKQVDALLNAGFKNADGFTAGYANVIMNSITERREKGLCTMKQMNVLRKAGIDGSHMSFEDASKHIDKISRNWKRSNKFNGTMRRR